MLPNDSVSIINVQREQLYGNNERIRTLFPSVLRKAQRKEKTKRKIDCCHQHVR